MFILCVKIGVGSWIRGSSDQSINVINTCSIRLCMSQKKKCFQTIGRCVQVGILLVAITLCDKCIFCFRTKHHHSIRRYKSAIKAKCFCLCFTQHYPTVLQLVPSNLKSPIFPSGYVIVKMVLSVVWKGADVSLQQCCLHSIGTSANLFYFAAHSC